MASRQIFAIHDGKAHLALEGTELSDRDYMIDAGIIKSKTDATYEKVVRGHVVAGYMTLYQGSHMTVPEKTPELFSRLRQISVKLGIDKQKPVRVATFGGPMGTHGSNSHRLNYLLWKIWSDEEAEPRPAK